MCRSLRVRRFLIPTLSCLGVLCLSLLVPSYHAFLISSCLPHTHTLTHTCRAYKAREVRYLSSRRSRLNHVCATPPNPDYITLYRDRFFSGCPLIHISISRPSLIIAHFILCTIISHIVLLSHLFCYIGSEMLCSLIYYHSTIRP
jgi:hypothetical protein